MHPELSGYNTKTIANMFCIAPLPPSPKFLGLRRILHNITAAPAVAGCCLHLGTCFTEFIPYSDNYVDHQPLSYSQDFALLLTVRQCLSFRTLALNTQTFNFITICQRLLYIARLSAQPVV